jgi:putative transposase
MKKKNSNSYRVDNYFIDSKDSAWSSCDLLCWNAKNLRNYANFIIRQEFFKNKKYLNYNFIQKKLQTERPECYMKLPTKLAQAVLRELDMNWKGFFATIKEYRKNPKKFLGPPKPPNYKDKSVGRACVSFNIQTISKIARKKNLLKLSSLDFLIKLRLFESVNSDGVVTYQCDPNLRDVAIVPHNDGYLVIANYLDISPKEKVSSGYAAGIDLGVNNLAAIATNNKEHSQFLVNGRPLKSMNAFFNKRLAKLRSELDLNQTKRGKKRIQKEIQKLCRKRSFRIKNYLYNVTKMLANQLASAGVTHLVVGKNIGWKQEVNIGTKANQTFVNIPHARFIDMLQHKWEKLGRTVETIEESYTSKCSFLDKEEICKHDSYLGNRKSRGLFVTKEGYKMNADINGGANILTKVISNAFGLWSNEDLIKGFVVSPRRLTMSKSGNTPITQMID